MSVRTIEVSNGRVVGNQSIVAFDDGGFYDHNGSKHYKNVDALIAAHPSLAVEASKPYKASGKSTKSSQNAAEVTKKARYFKECLDMKALDAYLPFYDFSRIVGNIGSTPDGNLVVMWYRPTSGGATPGTQYSMVQVRGTDPKWRTIRGSDAKTVECMVYDNGPVYCVCGTGDMLLLKSTGLNYLAFAADGAARNSLHREYIKAKVADREIRLIADNDESGSKVAEYLKDMGLKVRTFNWDAIKDAKEKMDLRDLAYKIAGLGGDAKTIEELLKGGQYE